VLGAHWRANWAGILNPESEIANPEPVRRRIEQPTEDQQKRSGCLIWGGMLGVLVGIMVGVYALPPILRHYYGEEKVAAGESYRGEGKVIRIGSIGQASDPLGEVAEGMRRFDFFVAVVAGSEREWRPKPTDFSLEFKELDDWQLASSGPSEESLLVPPGGESTLQLHFIVEVRRDDAAQLTPDALHLSNPPVRFDIE
jgi:hypothetical protein